nr:DnaT-like ssDNA-binding domain-containing protein [Pseudomonas aeruginosa]
MPSFQINDEEWDALFDEPHQLLKVYCAIRMFMDYRTGIAGETRRLSEQMLIEVLSIPASPGRPAHKATRKEARYTIDALVRRGMVEPMPSIGPFVFYLPKASRDQSVSERWGQRFDQGGARGRATEECAETTNGGAYGFEMATGGARGGVVFSEEVGPFDSAGEVGPEVGPSFFTGNTATTQLPANDIGEVGPEVGPSENSDEVGPEVGPRFEGLELGNSRPPEHWAYEVGPEVGPTSVLPPIPPPSRNAREAEPVSGADRFPMHEGWVPSAKGWAATLVRNGIGTYQLRDDELLEFRSYWINRPEKYQSQGQWEHELAQKIRRNQRFDQNRSSHGNQAGNAEGQAGHRAAKRGFSHRQGPRSAVDRVNAIVAANEAARQAAGTALGEDDRDVRAPLDVEFWRQPES